MRAYRRFLIPASLLLMAIVASCSDATSGPAPTSRTMSGSTQPVDLATLPESVAARYHFIESNRSVAERIPCYCGCNSLGHRSLYDCFVTRQGGYEPHGTGCGVCQAEALDVERLLGEGKNLTAIRAAIDATYASSGPPTKTP
jgi:hypothetical protein